MSARDDYPLVAMMGDPFARVPIAEQCRDALDEIDRLRASLDEAQLRSIEASNPGIDMDEVRRFRTGRVE